ncbi:ABC transporter ATP-binding protein [Candidatus Kaiserbacteria bacterium]|nr:ABC transporter ATP-binding protein [Candidatus Kaiserbacteria bacterium]
MLEARDLKKQFLSGESVFVLFEHLDFAAKAGEMVVITGRSGSGKSTLLYQLGLLDTPNDGVVSVDGIPASSLAHNARTDLRLERFGYVFQDYGLMPEMTALDNVLVPLIMRGESYPRAEAAARAALVRVGLGDRLSSKPARLSGGQQQRVSIARAIAHEPPYILADEPTANLDSASARQVLDMFSEIHRGGATIIMVTHEKESLALADRVLELRDGALLAVGTETHPPAVPSSLREGGAYGL